MGAVTYRVTYCDNCTYTVASTDGKAAFRVELGSVRYGPITSSVRQTTGLGRFPGDRGRTSAPSRRARAASSPGSQHGDLGHLPGRAEAVLDQPADVRCHPRHVQDRDLAPIST